MQDPRAVVEEEDAATCAADIFLMLATRNLGTAYTAPSALNGACCEAGIDKNVVQH